MVHVIIWWLLVQVLSILALPFTTILFKNLPDRGYAFGKALAILFVSYILWLAASTHILPNTRWAIILIIALCAIGSLIVFLRRRHEIIDSVSENRGVIIATETIFLLSFVLYAVVRAYNPDILHTEKPMDFAFLNAILRSDYFPPHDPWLSGHSLNNYYFGHLMVATLTKLSGISSAITFNLSLALMFALAAIGAFSIVYNLVRLSQGAFKTALSFGLVAAVFLLILGNLEAVLELLYAHGLGGEGFWGWIGINGLDNPTGGHWYPTEHWWWWRASRVISPANGTDTIAEFPFFSFLLGDLHAHLMSLPFALLSLAFSLNIFASMEPIGLTWLRKNLPLFVLTIISLGALSVIHTWDLPIYTFIFIAAALMQAYLRRDTARQHRWWLEWGIFSIITVVGIFLLYLPFHLTFQSPVLGILPWNGPTTRWLHYLIIWGLFLFIGISFILAHVRSGLKSVSWRNLGLISLIVLSPWILWAIVELVTGGGSSIWGKLGHLAPLFILLAVILLIVLWKVQRFEGDHRTVLFALLLLFTGLLLTVGCELFYMADTFFGRMNTLFRFYYASWVLLALASAFALYYLYRHWQVSSTAGRVVKWIWRGFLILLVTGSLIYPVAATWNRTNAFSASPALDGLAFLERSNPSEDEAITWLNSNIEGSPVILEAVGNDYSMFGRVSQFTGLPTVLGWEQHEWIWRGSDRDLKGRRDDVNLIYASSDTRQVQTLLEKYNVSLVYVGKLEREAYGSAVSDRFQNFMDVAFENQGVTIYSVRE